MLPRGRLVLEAGLRKLALAVFGKWDLVLGKWCGQPESNRRLQAIKPGVLPLDDDPTYAARVL